MVLTLFNYFKLMKTLFSLFIFSFCFMSLFAQGVTLDPAGDIFLDGTHGEVRFRTSDGMTTNGTLTFVDNFLFKGLIMETREANPIQFQTNNANRMIINSDGDVGIGTLSPETKLHIEDGDITVTGGNVDIKAAAPSLQFFNADGSLSYGSIASGFGNLLIKNNFTGANGDLRLETENGSFRLEDDGKVGIGLAEVETPLGDIHLRQTSNTWEDGSGMFFEDVFQKEGHNWQILNTGLHFSFIDRIDGDVCRRAYIEDDTGMYVVVEDICGNLRRNSKNAWGLQNALAKVQQLQPIYHQPAAGKRNTASKLGFNAQEVEQVIPELVHYGENGELGLAYDEFAVLAIQAIQEQQQQIDQKDQRVVDLEKENAELLVQFERLVMQFENLEARMNQQILAIENNLQSCCFQHHSKDFQLENKGSSFNNFQTDKAQLQQNFPNPFHQQTEIQYYLPETVQKAQIHIMDLTGKTLKTFELSQKGIGKVHLNGGQFTVGSYAYSLVIDGKVVDTKQMILTK